MIAKAVEPQVHADSFSCPHCSAISHQHWYRLFLRSVERDKYTLRIRFENVDQNSVQKIQDEDEKKRLMEFVARLRKHVLTYRVHQYPEESRWEFANLCLSRCYSCDGFAVWVEDRIIYPTRDSTIVPHEEMPDAVKEDFDEAASVVDKSPRGATALLRLCIQKLMPILGETSGNLDKDIGSLVTKGLEVEIQQALDIVRVVGNNAVHPGQIDLKDDKATAIKLFELLNLIVERRIATPKRIQALFEGLPEGALKAIAKRDGFDET
jgi:hypothetical protein